MVNNTKSVEKNRGNEWKGEIKELTERRDSAFARKQQTNQQQPHKLWKLSSSKLPCVFLVYNPKAQKKAFDLEKKVHDFNENSSSCGDA